MGPLICCPRCGHQNPAHARFCAGCGLNLGAAGVAMVGDDEQSTRRGRTWLLVIVLLGLLGYGVFLISTRL